MDLKTLAEFERTILINVWELYEEAKLLHQNGHYARAYTLAHLSFEENAKLTILEYLALDIIAGRDITSEAITKIFTSQLFINHTNKLRLSFLHIPDFDYQATVDLAKRLNKLKNMSIYTDISDGIIYKPSDRFDQDLSMSIIDMAKGTLKNRVELLGGENIDGKKHITLEMIEIHYEWLKDILEDEIPDRTIYEYRADGLVDYLYLILRNEDMYDQMKRSLIRSREARESPQTE